MDATDVGALLHLNCSNAVNVGPLQRMNRVNTNLAGFVWLPDPALVFFDGAAPLLPKKLVASFTCR
jgi:hypothetical protein